MDEAGKVIASGAEEHEAFLSPKPGWAEQDPRDWWRACGLAVRKALQSANLSGEDIACVGFSGQMHGAVLLDAQDEVVRSAIIWCDQRSEAQSKKLEQLFGLETLIQLTCNPPLTNFTLTKLLWVRETEPENWARVAHVMLPKDYVRFRLTGERAIDMADASGTLLLDVTHRRWSTEVLSKSGIDVGLLPALYESPQVCGKVSDAGAEATGLKVGTPVVAGAGDQAAGAVGMGIARGWRRQRNDWNFGSSICRDRSSGAGSQGTFAYLLPRHSRTLARDGCDAGCRIISAFFPRPFRSAVERRA